MSDFNANYDGLSRLPTQYQNADAEFRRLYPLLDSSAAAAASAPVVAAAIAELVGALTVAMDGELQSLTGDISGLHDTLRNYRNADDSAAAEANRLRRTPTTPTRQHR